MGRQAATRPGAGVVHGARHELAGGGVRGALVQLHGDVGADELLDAHVLLGRPVDLAAVVDGLERDPVVGELHGVGEAEYLKAAGVGEHGAVVVHEAVDAAGLGHQVGTGAHGQVVRVREHYLAAQLAQLARRDALHRGGGAHGHEHRGVEIAVGGGVGERAGVPAGSVARAIEECQKRILTSGASELGGGARSPLNAFPRCERDNRNSEDDAHQRVPSRHRCC